jgi:hypothetical protein
VPLSAACPTRGSSDVAISGSGADVDVQPHRSDGTPSDVASIVGTWEFAALTGVPPAKLPHGSIPDDRRDLVIRNDGSFRWGTWLGYVDGSDPGSALLIAGPTDLRQRFDDFGASVSTSIVGNRMQIWLLDLGQDRDVDVGDASKTSIRRTWSSGRSAARLSMLMYVREKVTGINAASAGHLVERSFGQ